MIDEPLLAAEARVEVFSIEVAVVDRVAGVLQRRDDGVMQRGVEARFQTGWA